MRYKNLLIPICGATLLALCVRYYWPRIETKTVTKTVVQKDIRTITRIVQRPDGTKETIIEHTDHSSATKSKTVAKNRPNWHASIGATPHALMGQPAVYSMQLERRILGPFYIGAGLSSNHEAKLIIGLEF